eukprot:scaffold88410_cov48-Phaeocystis_antarctica.AAC.1
MERHIVKKAPDSPDSPRTAPRPRPKCKRHRPPDGDVVQQSEEHHRHDGEVDASVLAVGDDLVREVVELLQTLQLDLANLSVAVGIEEREYHEQPNLLPPAVTRDAAEDVVPEWHSQKDGPVDERAVQDRPPALVPG